LETRSNMPVNPFDIQRRIDSELAKVNDARVVSHVRGLLVDPVAVERHWDYGVEDQTFPCWTVLRHEKTDTAIVFCEFGFGPRSPWGLVAESKLFMGMDSGWLPTFMAAYFESFAATEIAIWRVFLEEGLERAYSPLTEEGDWTSTWAEIERRRRLFRERRYHCGHSIAVN
jgi:hypothetical protein